MVEIRYDREADALYVTLARDVTVVRTDQVDDRTLVDVDAAGRPAGRDRDHRPSRGWVLGEVLERYPLADDDAATLRQVFGSPTVASADPRAAGARGVQSTNM